MLADIETSIRPKDEIINYKEVDGITHDNSADSVCTISKSDIVSYRLIILNRFLLIYPLSKRLYQKKLIF